MDENDIIKQEQTSQSSADKTSTVIASTEVIQNMVYVVRGQQIMIDSDLASLYHVETKNLNRAMKRNQQRFPDNFCFQLLKEEEQSLRCQIGTSKNGDSDRGGRRYLPYVYTEQGIAMLSAVLKSNVAVRISINIMNAFVEMRRYMANTTVIQERLTNVETTQRIQQKQTDEKFEQVFNYISTHSESEQKIFFEGQIYDAFQVLTDIISQANHNIVLIDDYVDTKTLNLFKEKKSGVIVDIWTHSNTRLSDIDVATFNAQYPRVIIHHTNTFHDRFLIIDGETAYTIGSSLKDAGKKCFAITKINDRSLIRLLIEHIK